MTESVKLSENGVYQLIEEVRNNECLWNMQCKTYNHSYYTNAAWREIAEKLNMPEHYLRTKWKVLRDTYRKEARKLGPYDVYQGKWQYFRDMEFCRKFHYRWKCKEDVTTESCFVPCDGQDESYFFQDADEEDPLPPVKRRKEKDYDVMYLESLLPFFRELVPIRKLVLRTKIHDALMQEFSRNAVSRTRKERRNMKEIG